jgi:choline dehydrogenase
MRYTHVVVGAGTAGCILAEGLSRAADATVLLIEAGPDYSGAGSVGGAAGHEQLPAELADGTTPVLQGRHDWQVMVQGPRGRRIHLPRGRVIGGSSQVNSCIALRPEPVDRFMAGEPADPRWSWERILQCLNDIEHDLDFDGPHHGRTGPLAIRRPAMGELTALGHLFLDDCAEAGFPRIADHNAPGSTGAAPAPLNLTPAGRRISSSDAFLAGARDRANLRVIAGAPAIRVLLDGGVARGVLCQPVGRAGPVVFEAENVVLAAGAIGTPEVLLRSGIGPAAALEAAGVEVAVDLPGVGANLSDHSQVPLVFLGTDPPDRGVPCVQALLRYSSRAGGLPNDMQLCLINHVRLDQYMPDVARLWESSSASSLTSNLMHPVVRGSVRLVPGDRGPRTVVAYAYADDPADLARHREGVRLLHHMLTAGLLSSAVKHLHAPADGVLADDGALDAWILGNVQPGHHPMGTARLGDPRDAATVVTPELAVRGTRGLFVADASVFAHPVRANTNLAVMAVAKNAVDLIPAV